MQVFVYLETTHIVIKYRSRTLSVLKKNLNFTRKSCWGHFAHLLKIVFLKTNQFEEKHLPHCCDDTVTSSSNLFQQWRQTLHQARLNESVLCKSCRISQTCSVKVPNHWKQIIITASKTCIIISYLLAETRRDKPPLHCNLQPSSFQNQTNNSDPIALLQSFLILCNVEAYDSYA